MKIVSTKRRDGKVIGRESWPPKGTYVFLDEYSDLKPGMIDGSAAGHQLLVTLAILGTLAVTAIAAVLVTIFQ